MHQLLLIVLLMSCSINPFFPEQRFNNKSDREYVETLWNYLVSNDFFIFIFVEMKLFLRQMNCR